MLMTASPEERPALKQVIRALLRRSATVIVSNKDVKKVTPPTPAKVKELLASRSSRLEALHRAMAESDKGARECRAAREDTRRAVTAVLKRIKPPDQAELNISLRLSPSIARRKGGASSSAASSAAAAASAKMVASFQAQEKEAAKRLHDAQKRPSYTEVQREALVTQPRMKTALPHDTDDDEDDFMSAASGDIDYDSADNYDVHEVPPTTHRTPPAKLQPVTVSTPSTPSAADTTIVAAHETPNSANTPRPVAPVQATPFDTEMGSEAVVHNGNRETAPGSLSNPSTPRSTHSWQERALPVSAGPPGAPAEMREVTQTVARPAPDVATPAANISQRDSSAPPLTDRSPLLGGGTSSSGGGETDDGTSTKKGGVCSCCLIS